MVGFLDLRRCTPKENELFWYLIDVGCNKIVIWDGKGREEEKGAGKERRSGREQRKIEGEYQFISLSKFFLLQWKRFLFLVGNTKKSNPSYIS